MSQILDLHPSRIQQGDRIAVAQYPQGGGVEYVTGVAADRARTHGTDLWSVPLEDGATVDGAPFEYCSVGTRGTVRVER